MNNFPEVKRSHIGAAIAASVVATWAIALLLDVAATPSRESWVAAFQVVSSAALFTITAAYVVLTARLVRAQQEAALQAAQLGAAARLIERLIPTQQAAYELSQLFPLKAGAGRPDRQKLNELVKVLQDGSSSLFLAMHSLPASISMEAGEKSNRIADRVSEVLAFANALLIADKAAQTGNHVWNWDESARRLLSGSR